MFHSFFYFFVAGAIVIKATMLSFLTIMQTFHRLWINTYFYGCSLCVLFTIIIIILFVFIVIGFFIVYIFCYLFVYRALFMYLLCRASCLCLRIHLFYLIWFHFSCFIPFFTPLFFEAIVTNATMLSCLTILKTFPSLWIHSFIFVIICLTYLCFIVLC